MTESRSILFVEDDPTLRGVISAALRNKGHMVFERESAEEALSTMERVVSPALIILDVDLPGTSGIDLCKCWVALQQKTAPILFLTASDDVDTLKACMAAGGDDFTIKSSPISQILERVGYWLERRGRMLSDKRRQAILDQVEEFAVVRAEAQEQDKSFQAMVAALGAGLRLAFSTLPDQFGSTVTEKLYLLGYVTGAASKAANDRLDLKIRFLDFLRACLLETQTLSRSDASRMVANLGQLYSVRSFRQAMSAGARFWNDTILGGGVPESLADLRSRISGLDDE